MTETRPLLARFFSYYRPYKGLFILDFGCAVAAGLLQLGFPLAVKYFVDELLPGQNWGLLLACAAALLAVYVANAGLMAIVTYWGHALGVGIETDMRAEAFDHLQKLSFRFYDNAQTGQLITHVTKDLEEVGEIAHHGPEVDRRRQRTLGGIVVRTSKSELLNSKRPLRGKATAKSASA